MRPAADSIVTNHVWGTISCRILCIQKRYDVDLEWYISALYVLYADLLRTAQHNTIDDARPNS